MDNKTYYLGISSDYKVIKSTSFEDLRIRNDIEHFFTVIFKKRTPKNTFYEILYVDKEMNPIEAPKFKLKRIEIKYMYGEFWGIWKENIKGKVLTFQITDLLGCTISKNFHCYPHHTSGLENLLIYCEHLSRLGTHQAVSEVFNLKDEIEKLNKKIDNLKKRKLN